jgi:hypothetical protein
MFLTKKFPTFDPLKKGLAYPQMRHGRGSTVALEYSFLNFNVFIVASIIFLLSPKMQQEHQQQFLAIEEVSGAVL